ncbi:phytanoyl-CoA dioxygenase family protein [Pseudomonas sp. B21-012]|uniref:phytanoyl-CoA dioxygenase family protein n=1 Tax=unclassified Pseudomonas TaxID=196821 RepID=UPI001BCB5167|nr:MULTISPECIES: phytanoyl-CoA dioxygenase family protein [unclassified Pseudomonas]QVM98102.1 phytanoyl-CoA dioxygenase family protein [Pseudomonas sp. SORT22]UVL55015.1 phytanoyl-CoA dioxygenase family protein [Pseudomonas sp. B21-035]UVL60303.1 phytanoyl-CoA dioxygenase family protein [Pseudomonas sp. B21-032]UVM54580.1 phytanoyl-CoA dioxygenase family protein [Pseudomonas sp. B21-012]
MAGSTLKKIVGRVYPFRRLAFFTQRLITRPGHREALSEVACKRLPAKSSSSPLPQHELGELGRNGYVMLDDLVTSDQVAQMKEYFQDKQAFDRWNAASGLFDPAHPPADCHTAPFLNSDIAQSPWALKWANDSRVLAIVENWLGAKPTLSNLSVWWSYPGHDTPQEAECFHRDVDDLRFIKLFIYLSDVDEGAGPHVFVPGSHKHDGFNKIRRYSDSEVIEAFGQDGIKYFTGEQGSAFLENTFGLHKGQLPTHKPRLLFQAQYSLHPIGIYEYAPVSVELGAPLDNYINRLYVK